MKYCMNISTSKEATRKLGLFKSGEKVECNHVHGIRDGLSPISLTPKVLGPLSPSAKCFQFGYVPDVPSIEVLRIALWKAYSNVSVVWPSWYLVKCHE